MTLAGRRRRRRRRPCLLSACRPETPHESVVAWSDVVSERPAPPSRVTLVTFLKKKTLRLPLFSRLPPDAWAVWPSTQCGRLTRIIHQVGGNSHVHAGVTPSTNPCRLVTYGQDWTVAWRVAVARPLGRRSRCRDGTVTRIWVLVPDRLLQ